jgi:hypothetical protein
LPKIVKNHLASNRYYQEANSLIHGNGLIDSVNILDDKIMSVIDLLKKTYNRYQEWNEVYKKE